MLAMDSSVEAHVDTFWLLAHEDMQPTDLSLY